MKSETMLGTFLPFPRTPWAVVPITSLIEEAVSARLAVFPNISVRKIRQVKSCIETSGVLGRMIASFLPSEVAGEFTQRHLVKFSWRSNRSLVVKNCQTWRAVLHLFNSLKTLLSRYFFHRKILLICLISHVTCGYYKLLVKFYFDNLRMICHWGFKYCLIFLE